MVSLEYLAFEVTRRCNEWCKMCMRGNPEEVDMSEEIVNKVLLNNYIKDIDSIMFTGGEPTLNDKLICYIIDLVIKNSILVNQFCIVTNAKKFPKDALEAFNDYLIYCKYQNTKGKIAISFSVDAFHENYPDIIREYQEKYPQFQYEFKSLNWIWKTGRSDYGDKFEYGINPMFVRLIMGYIWVMNPLYVTAKGNYETMGDGMYLDMDKINMGSVFDNSLLDILNQYGKVNYGTEEEFKKLLYMRKNK